MLGRICPRCHDLLPGGGPCPRPECTTHGKTTTDRRLAAVEVWQHPRFRALRPVVFERDGWRCVECGRTDRTRTGKGLVADHVEEFEGVDDPLAFDLENLQTLCLVCSGRKDGARSAQGR